MGTAKPRLRAPMSPSITASYEQRAGKGRRVPAQRLSWLIQPMVRDLQVYLSASSRASSTQRLQFVGC